MLNIISHLSINKHYAHYFLVSLSFYAFFTIKFTISVALCHLFAIMVYLSIHLFDFIGDISKKVHKTMAYLFFTMVLVIENIEGSSFNPCQNALRITEGLVDST